MNNIRALLVPIIILTFGLVSFTFGQSPEVELVVQSGHTEIIEAMAFSPDGKLLASSSEDITILWDVQLGLRLRTISTPDLSQLKFTPDGKFLIGVGMVARNPGFIAFWNLANPEKEYRRVSHNHFTGNLSIAISPDGALLAVATEEVIFMYNWKESEVLYQIEVEKEQNRNLFAFTGVNFSPNGKYLVNGKNKSRFRMDDKHGLVEIRRTNDGSMLNQLKRTKEKSDIYEVKEVHFVNEQELAILYAQRSSSPTEIVLWDWQKNRKQKPSPEFKAYDQSNFDYSSKQIVVKGYGRLRVLSYPYSDEGFKIPTDGNNLHSFAWNPTSEIAALSTGIGFQGRIQIYNTKTGNFIRAWGEPLGGVTSIDFEENGLLAAINIRHVPRIWNLKNNAGYIPLAAGNAPLENFSNGKIYITKEAKQAIYTEHHKSYYWREHNLDQGKKFPGVDRFINKGDALAISPNQRWAVTIFGEVYDLQKMEIVKKLELNKTSHATRSIAYSPNGKILLTSGYEFIQRWRLPSFEPLPDIPLKRTAARKMEISHLGVLATLEKTQLKLRTLETGSPFASLDIMGEDICFSPDGKILMVAVDDRIDLYDAQNLDFHSSLIGHQSKVNCLSMSPEGKLLASGSDDGLIKLWNWKTRKLVASMAGLTDGDFFIYTPDHYYMTKRGVGKAAFRLGNDKLYPFEQFDLQYNRPDIVLDRIGFADQELIQAFRRAHEKRLEKLGYLADYKMDFDQLPQVDLTKQIPQNINDSVFALHIHAEDTHQRLASLHVLVNEVPIYGEKGKSINTGKIYNGVVNVPLLSGNNRIHIFVTNQKGASSLWETFDLYFNGQLDKPDLYLVTIGVSKYQNEKMNLRYATEDAKDVTSLFKARPGLFRKRYYYQFWDEQATRNNILDVKRVLAKSRTQDLVVIFLAGHGVLDQNLDYYFASHDMDFENPAKKGLRFDELENLLDDIPALQKTLLIDACHAGEVDKDAVELVEGNTSNDGKIIFRALPNYTVRNKQLGLANSFELMKHLFTDLRRKSGAVVIAAAGGAEYAMEGEDYQNGIFTYTFLKGLQETQDKKGFVLADVNQDEEVSIKELQDYLIANVAQLTDNRQQPLTRVDYLYNDFPLLKYHRGKSLKPNLVNFSKAELEEMIDSGLDLTQKDENGATVLMRVVYNLKEDDPAIIAKLINYGADPFQKGVIYPKSSGGYIGNLLSTAAVALKPKMLEYLIQKANIPVDDREWNPDTKKEDGWTALQWAAVATSQKTEALQVVEVLLNNGANINEQRSGSGSTPLMLAMQKQEATNKAIALLLIDRGADLTIVDEKGWNSLHYAARYGHYEIVNKLLEKGLKADQRAKNGIRPVDLALQHKHYLCLTAMLNGKSGVQKIIEQGKDQQAIEISHSLKNYRTLLAAIFDKNKEIIRAQITAGADLNARDRHGATFFMHIVHHFKLPFVVEMVESGADYHKKGVIWTGEPGEGYYGNVMGIAAAKNDYSLLEFFIKNCKIPIDDQEYDPATKSETGWTALQWAASSGALAAIDLLLNYKAEVNVGEKTGDTPLLLFMRNYSNSRITQRFMANGANLQIKDIDGATPLHYACRDKLYDQGGQFLANKIIAGGVPINAVDNFGWTPLMCAANQGHHLLCQWLMKNGADCKLQNKDGQTAIDLAKKKGYYRAIEVLEAC